MTDDHPPRLPRKGYGGCGHRKNRRFNCQRLAGESSALTQLLSGRIKERQLLEVISWLSACTDLFQVDDATGWLAVVVFWMVIGDAKESRPLQQCGAPRSHGVQKFRSDPEPLSCSVPHLAETVSESENLSLGFAPPLPTPVFLFLQKQKQIP